MEFMKCRSCKIIPAQSTTDRYRLKLHQMTNGIYKTEIFHNIIFIAVLNYCDKKKDVRHYDSPYDPSFILKIDRPFQNESVAEAVSPSHSA